MAKQRKYAALSDEGLCQLLKVEGAERDTAFGELYSRYSSRIWLYCKRAMPSVDNAQDIYHETFIRFFKSSQTMNEFTNVPAYLLRIARNLILNAKRDERPSVPIEDFQMPYIDTTYEQKETSELIAMSLELLPEQYREVLTLQVYGGMSYQEISEMMGVPVTTVRNWIVRAKQQMQKILTPYLSEPKDGERQGA